jgi:Tfp pilus assembly protein PilF
LVKAERGDLKGAEKSLKEAFKSDPQQASAAYNLCIITAKEHPAESLDWCKIAVTLRPQEPKYASTLAFYQQQGGDSAAAITTLENLISRAPTYPDAYLLLADIYEKQRKKAQAVKVYQQALAVEGMSAKAKEYIKSRLEAVQGRDRTEPRNSKKLQQ